MKIILKSYDEPEIPSDVLPSVISWAQRNNSDRAAAKFEMTSGVYWAYKYLTKTGTKVVSIRTERKKERRLTWETTRTSYCDKGLKEE